MTPDREQPAHPASEDAPPTDAAIESYVRAVEGLDASRVAGPAAALAELLEARLAGTDAPQVREMLDSLVADSGYESYHSQE
jgi:hypothetical protein